MSETVHMTPRPGTGVMPCCGQSVFELPRDDRMTLIPSLVTCAPDEEKNR